MRKLTILLVCLSLIWWLPPTSASGSDASEGAPNSGPIRLSDDGRTVSMPVEVFRAREGDLLRLEALVGTLKRQLDEEREAYNLLALQAESLEAAIKTERAAAYREKRNSGILGFILGGVAVGIAK